MRPRRIEKIELSIEKVRLKRAGSCLDNIIVIHIIHDPCAIQGFLSIKNPKRYNTKKEIFILSTSFCQLTFTNNIYRRLCVYGDLIKVGVLTHKHDMIV